ncbi:hypothetical protein Tco_1578279 [Tanacetum coccineum]
MTDADEEIKLFWKEKKKSSTIVAADVVVHGKQWDRESGKRQIDSNTTLDSTNMCHMGGEIVQDAEQYQVKILDSGGDDSGGVYAPALQAMLGYGISDRWERLGFFVEEVGELVWRR